MLHPDNILKYLNKTASESQVKELDKWLNASVKNREEYEFLATIHQESNHLADFDLPDVDAEWGKFMASIDAPVATSPLTVVKKSEAKVFGLRQFLSYAAAASVALIAGIYLFFPKDNMITVESGASDMAISLSDGSNILLNANSVFTYPEDFTKEKLREVKLVGMASFDVAKDAIKPFLIRADETTVKVMGTTIDVAADPGYSKVAVIEGKVKFYVGDDESSAMMLNTGDIVEYANGQMNNITPKPEPIPEPEPKEELKPEPIPEPIPEPEPVIEKTPEPAPKPLEKPEPVPEPIPEPVVEEPAVKLGKYTLETVIMELERKFEGKFKKNRKCKIDKKIIVNVNLNSDLSDIIKQIESDVKIEYNQDKCSDCYELEKVLDKE